MGNKSRFLDVIQAAVEDVAAPGARACDLFAGTGVVTRRLAQKRPVLSCDIQAYSVTLTEALTSPRRLTSTELARLQNAAQQWLSHAEPAVRELLEIEEHAIRDALVDPRPLAEVLETGSLAVTEATGHQLQAAKEAARTRINPELATLTWYYGGVYFSYRQALHLDALRHAIRQIWGADRDPTAVAAVLGVASDIVSTVGNHFAQPVQPRRSDGTLKRNWVASVTRSRRAEVTTCFDAWIAKYAALPRAPFRCEAVQADFRTTLSELDEVGVIYADPPYTRDHYSRFYHVLETIAVDDLPGITLAPGSDEPGRGLYRETRHQSPFCIRSQARSAFQELFSHAKRLDAPLVLSYSPRSAGTTARPETRLVSVEGLVDLAGEYFSDVRIFPVDASRHSRFNRVELSAPRDGAAEVLIVGKA
jgi:adenine-specific DNA-methyltransferase